MLLLLLTSLWGVFAANTICNMDDTLNNYNPGCNWAGLCYNSGDACLCCDSTEEENSCTKYFAWDSGKWTGDHCDTVEQFISNYISFHLVDLTTDTGTPGQIECSSTYGVVVNRAEEATANSGGRSQLETVVQTMGYPGTIQSVYCDNCVPGTSCDFLKKPAVTEGMVIKFGTDFNTFYDHGCQEDNLPGTYRGCAANYDYGAAAFNAMHHVLESELTFITNMQTECDKPTGEGGMGWTTVTIDAGAEKHNAFTQDNVALTPVPTKAPTPQPTTPAPLDLQDTCSMYTNAAEDLHFQKVASTSCRKGILQEWPGSRTCSSPYVVCLPSANTPSNDMNGNLYQSTTHRYSVDECIYECKNDQRCLGFEFVADSNSNLGDCNLIDDIPIEPLDAVDGWTYAGNEANLDSSVTGGNALCWEKKDYCNPSFVAAQLSTVMMNCYCPNNRKGFYTKKVTRSEETTHYCDDTASDEAAISDRIKRAQANRMFHLCENWCLFETDNPNAEMWYYDPWKQCWREQFAGVGAHASYCYRVIRDPDTIEMQFLNYRAKTRCGAEAVIPTGSPSVLGTTMWKMAADEQDCVARCAEDTMLCDENETADAVLNTNTEGEIEAKFTLAGISCTTVSQTGNFGYALPGLHTSSNTCIARDPNTEDTGCDVGIGVGYQRLCACYSAL